jgi:hypothetical protein
MDVIHRIIIFMHVLFGAASLITGTLILILKKGTTLHQKLGKLFLVFLVIVIIIAFTGIFILRANEFFFVISLVSGYEAWSGYRVLKNKFFGPRTADNLIALLAFFFSIIYFIIYRQNKMWWPPVVIYSTAGWLFFLSAYDLSRILFKNVWLAKMWPYEHIVKMCGAYFAVLSAIAGTVLPTCRPYSQLLPIGIAFCTIAFFCFRKMRGAYE